MKKQLLFPFVLKYRNKMKILFFLSIIDYFRRNWLMSSFEIGNGAAVLHL